MGAHLILPGEALGLSRRAGITDRELIRHVLKQGGKMARLDVAIDLFGAKLTADHMAQAYAKGCLKSPARSGEGRKGIRKPGETFTLGSRVSDRYFRAYDKNAEQGIVNGEAWLRLELELKRMRAHGVANVIAQEDNTRRVINRAIGDFVQMENDELKGALNDQSGPLPTEGRKVHKTYTWLIEQVAPAMARYQAEHPNEDVIEALITAYTEELNRLTDRPSPTSPTR